MLREKCLRGDLRVVHDETNTPKRLFLRRYEPDQVRRVWLFEPSQHCMCTPEQA
jgi:hypothetical protein